MNHRANKDLGQHFLIDQQVLNFIARAIAPQTHKHIVEIGPGTGALTRHLLACPSLDLIELDRTLAQRLRQSLISSDSGRVSVYQADALGFDFRTILRAHESAVVGNLPYNIASQLILKVLELEIPLAPSVYLVQKEMALRASASPGSSQYGRFSVMVQYHAAVSYLLDVPPQAFDPAPQVDSAVIMLRQHTADDLRSRERAHGKVTHALFASVVKMAFANKRKQLHNNLPPIISKNDLALLFSHPFVRAEDLSVEDFICLARAMEQRGYSEQ